MKKINSWILLMAMVINVSTPLALAKPERIQIKKKEEMAKTQLAEAQFKSIDLRTIEDPEARRAIGEILNYLNLQTKK